MKSPNAFKVTETSHSLNLEFFIAESSNALSLSAARELATIQKAHAKWKKPVVVSSRHLRLFCSGGNLSDYKKLKGKAPGLKINREITKILDAFGQWNVPKLAVINGDVLGGGMEWLGRFDFRWSTPNAVFAFWQKRIGLSPGWGGGRAWAAKIGEDRVRRLLLEGRMLGAPEALGQGLVDRVVSSWKIEEESAHWAANMNAPSLQKILKWKSTSEAATFSALWMTPEHVAVLKGWKG